MNRRMQGSSFVKKTQKVSDEAGGFRGFLNTDDNFGRSLATIPDLDGDGITELAVGANGDNDGSTNAGAVWILFLRSDGTIKSHQKLSDFEGGFTGQLDEGDSFGISVAAIADMDSDGVPELAVGAMLDDDGASDAGALWILFMRSTGTVKSHQKISQTEGGFTGQLGTQDWFGSSLAFLDGMGAAGEYVVAVGAYGDDDGMRDAGAVWINFLRSAGTVKSSQKISDTQGTFGGTFESYMYFGFALAALPDLDMDTDSVPELVTSSPGDDFGRFSSTSDFGSVWVMFLRTDGTVKYFQKISTEDGGLVASFSSTDWFGSSIGMLPDLDGNGIPELVVGAYLDDDGERSSTNNDYGAAYVLYLKDDGSVSRTQKISQTHGGFTGQLDFSDRFGSAAATMGGMGSAEQVVMAIGSYQDDDSDANAGALYFLFIDGPSPSASPTPSITPSVSPTPSATPSFSPTSSTTATVSPSTTATVSPSTTATVSPSSTSTATVSSTPSSTSSNSPTPSVTPSNTPTASVTPSTTPSSSQTPSNSPTSSPTASITSSSTGTPTPSQTETPSPSSTPSSTVTPSSSSTSSATPTPTSSQSPTPSTSPSPSSTSTATASPTPTPSTSAPPIESNDDTEPDWCVVRLLHPDVVAQNQPRTNRRRMLGRALQTLGPYEQYKQDQLAFERDFLRALRSITGLPSEIMDRVVMEQDQVLQDNSAGSGKGALVVVRVEPLVTQGQQQQQEVQAQSEDQLASDGVVRLLRQELQQAGVQRGTALNETASGTTPVIVADESTGLVFDTADVPFINWCECGGAGGATTWVLDGEDCPIWHEEDLGFTITGLVVFGVLLLAAVVGCCKYPESVPMSAAWSLVMLGLQLADVLTDIGLVSYLMRQELDGCGDGAIAYASAVIICLTTLANVMCAYFVVNEAKEIAEGDNENGVRDDATLRAMRRGWGIIGVVCITSVVGVSVMDLLVCRLFSEPALSLFMNSEQDREKMERRIARYGMVQVLEDVGQLAVQLVLVIREQDRSAAVIAALVMSGLNALRLGLTGLIVGLLEHENPARVAPTPEIVAVSETAAVPEPESATAAGAEEHDASRHAAYQVNEAETPAEEV